MMTTKPRLFEPDFDKPATLSDLQTLLQTLEGFDKTVSELQQSQMTPEQIKASVAEGMVQGLTTLIRDEKVMRAFWQNGYAELSKQATGDANQWVGKRVLTALSAGILVAFLVWSVKTGHIR